MSVQQKIAEWLCDEFGDDNETEADYMPDAMDLINYLRAKDIHVVNSSMLNKPGRKRFKSQAPPRKPEFIPKGRAS